MGIDAVKMWLVMDRWGPSGVVALISAMLVLVNCHSRSTGPVLSVILILVIPAPPIRCPAVCTPSEVRVPSVRWHTEGNCRWVHDTPTLS